MWTYRQSTGEIIGQTLIAVGYSGKGECKNDPAAQTIHNKGPIPRGLFEMEEPRDSPTHGPFAIPLKPHMDNQMFGRSAFMIHGDSIAKPGEASEGCIIAPRMARGIMWDSGDHIVQVVP